MRLISLVSSQIGNQFVYFFKLKEKENNNYNNNTATTMEYKKLFITYSSLPQVSET